MSRGAQPAGRALTVRVRYPLTDGRIELRTDRDWEASLQATRRSEDGTEWDFDLEPDRSYLYFKPVLVRDGRAVWSRGDNYLALPDGKRVVEVHPYFFEDGTCSVCEPHELPSRRSGRRHTLRVFLPPGYGENTVERYPVLFMQDGQNLFFPEEAFGGHHWRIAETLEILGSMNLVRKLIVVGVYPVERQADYTLPGYEHYGRYLVEDVKPWLDATHRTLRGPAHTAVMGSSLGGVVSFYLAWEHPRTFGHAACLSTTFGWRDDLFARVAVQPKRRVRFYVDSGWPADNYEVTRGMRNLLRRRGYVEGRDLLYLAFPQAAHNEQAWAVRAHIPLQFFFGQDTAPHAAADVDTATVRPGEVAAARRAPSPGARFAATAGVSGVGFGNTAILARGERASASGEARRRG